MPYSDPDEKRAYMAQWMWERRDRWVRANGPCSQCGSTDRLHVHGLGDRRPWSYTEAKRKKMLEGCVVLCHTCWCATPGAGPRIHDGVNHGSLLGYKHYGCRCTDCTRANREAVTRQRTVTPRNRLRQPLADALDALRSIWQNTDDPWIKQRAWGVLLDNLTPAQLAEVDPTSRTIPRTISQTGATE